jgi:hypothetical protein
VTVAGISTGNKSITSIITKVAIALSIVQLTFSAKRMAMILDCERLAFE